MIPLEMPPGTSSQSTACSRQATWFRARPRSQWRLDRTLSTAGWSSAATSCRVAEGSAAIATDPPRRGPSCYSPRPRAAAPGRPAWAGHRAPARQRRRAAGPRPRGPHPQLAKRLLGRADRHRAWAARASSTPVPGREKAALARRRSRPTDAQWQGRTSSRREGSSKYSPLSGLVGFRPVRTGANASIVTNS